MPQDVASCVCVENFSHPFSTVEATRQHLRCLEDQPWSGRELPLHPHVLQYSVLLGACRLQLRHLSRSALKERCNASAGKLDSARGHSWVVQFNSTWC